MSTVRKVTSDQMRKAIREASEADMKVYVAERMRIVAFANLRAYFAAAGDSRDFDPHVLNQMDCWRNRM